MPTRMRLAVLMDPIASIIPAKDSTLAMMLAAQSRDVELLYFEQRDLWVRDGVALARLRPVSVRNDLRNWFALGDPFVAPLRDVDVVLMRKDPPFDTEYVYTTYLLERAEVDGALVVNRPQGLRDVNEKVFTAWFPDCCAPTLITRDMRDMAAFLAEHGQVVCKPLYGMGGRSVFVLEAGDKNANVVFETLTDFGRQFAMAQVYIPEISLGDKRILLFDGEPVPYALARIPSEDDNRGNLVMGATGKGQPLSERDREICARVGPVLRDAGVIFAGIDVIGDYLTEVNVTSPTGMREIDAQFELNTAGLMFDAIERRLGRKG